MTEITIEQIKKEIHAVYGEGYAHRDVEVSFREWKKEDADLHRIYINVEDNRTLNTLYIEMKSRDIHFSGRNATYKKFGSEVAKVVEKYKDFIINTFATKDIDNVKFEKTIEIDGKKYIIAAYGNSQREAESNVDELIRKIERSE